jgi:chemotaxis protein MotB
VSNEYLMPEEEESKGGAPGWIVTFADMMSLLLCFFVLLLASSSTDARKFRAIADSMRETFSFNKEPVPGKATPKTSKQSQIELPPRNQMTDADEESARAMYEAQMNKAKAEIDQFVDAEGLANYIETRVEGDKLRIVNSNPLNFPAGDAKLLESSFEYLDMLLVVLQKFEFDIIIEGHTDNRPISNAEYRSNWELSAGRAASFVLYLEANGVDPARLALHGYGPHRPVASNDSEATRSRNRRIEVLLRDPNGFSSGSEEQQDHSEQG